MDIKPLRGFEHYLEIGDDHVEKNSVLLGDDYQMIADLDNLFTNCLNIALPDDSNLAIPAFLNLISHQEFYAAMASFLRLHKTQSFRCLRAALDSTFTAYYLLKNPDQTELYLNKGKNPSAWESIFRNIKVTIKHNRSVYPLAAGLPEIYDLCSKFSHADPEGIFHKYFMDKRRLRLYVQYFDFEKTSDEYRKWYAFLLFFFFKIFLIYWDEMLKGRAGKMKRDIDYLIKEYRTKITVLRKKYPVR
jgi:hypothetical protein